MEPQERWGRLVVVALVEVAQHTVAVEVLVIVHLAKALLVGLAHAGVIGRSVHTDSLHEPDRSRNIGSVSRN